jgi:hypothetical protein
MSTSKHLNSGQLAALCRLGDILIPGDADLPSFSRSGSIDHVDRMLDYMYESDLSGVKALLSVFRFTPSFLIRGIMLLTERQRSFPEPLGQVCRMINLGLKGVVMTLYYSDLGTGPSVLQVIHWDSQVVERDEEAQPERVSEAG